MNIVLLSLAVAVLLAAQAIYYLYLYSAQKRRTELRRRLRALGDASKSRSLLRQRRLARSPALARLLEQVPGAERIEQLLTQTDLDWTVASVLGVGLLVGVGLSIGLGFLLGTPLLGLVALPLGFAAPLGIILQSRRRRGDKLSSQLPDALDMMGRSLRAGHGLGAGFKLVATEMPLPVAMEFGRCFEEQQAGASFRDAVGNMTRRVPGNLDLRIFATSVIIQHETGGNLVEILDKIGHTIRERYKFYGKLRALTTEMRLSGYILGALPFVCGLAVALVNPNYLHPLFADPMGRVILLGGLISWAIGSWWMYRLAQVDY